MTMSEDKPFISVFDTDQGPPAGLSMPDPREGRIFGGVKLSIQASAFTYCEPRVDGLPLKDYSAVEIALIRELDGTWLRPSDLISFKGPTDEECNFGGDDVAGWVPQEVVRRLERALYDWAAGGVCASKYRELEKPEPEPDETEN